MKPVVRVVCWLGVAVVALLLAALLVVAFAGGPLIKSGVNRFGSQLLGVRVSVKDAELSVFRGHVRLTGLFVGNPEGFKTPSLLEASDVTVDLEPLTLFGNTLHIRDVCIQAPHITYEAGPDGSNIDQIKKTLGIKKDKAPAPTPTPEAEAAPATPPASGSPAAPKAEPKKVIIDLLRIVDPQLNASAVVAGGAYVPVKIETIEIKDIGREKGGITVAEAVKVIVRSVGENIDRATGGIREAAKSITDAARDVFKSFKEAFSGKKKDAKKKDGKAPPPAAP
jgi:hypothetical protein